MLIQIYDYFHFIASSLIYSDINHEEKQKESENKTCDAYLIPLDRKVVKDVVLNIPSIMANLQNSLN